MTNKILALKYRPQEFKDLIGQEVMAQTITNAIKLGKTPEQILTNLQTKNYCKDQIEYPNKLASDNEYQDRVRNVDADTPPGLPRTFLNLTVSLELLP